MGLAKANTMSPNDFFTTRVTYTAQVEGDKIDEMIEAFVRDFKVKLPINRIENSKYLFGMKLFNAKIINGILMVRVGGGYMTMEEFVEKNSNKEILNIRVKMAKEKKKLNKVISEALDKYKFKKFM